MARQSYALFDYPEKPSLEKSDRLLRVFEDIHNHVYANDGLSPEQALDETLKILFLKVYDEKNKDYKFKITPIEFDNIINGKNASDFLNRFKELQQNAFGYFSDLFEKNDKIKLKVSTFGFVVNKLQNIDLLGSASDIKGLAFQKFIHSSQRVGRGQFFTPDHIIKLCVEMLQPRANETILDPACGSAGFLSCAFHYVSRHEPAKMKSFAKNNVYGIEINKTAAKVSKMRVILEGGNFSNIVQHDSLFDWSSIDFELNRMSGKEVKTYREFFDLILTNPPFGTQGKVTDKSILRNFDLGYKWNNTDLSSVKTNKLLNGQVPEILFIERCLQFLKPGGRLAIVLPNGDFENSSLLHVRSYIEKTADVLAVIKLPQETFIPSGTGVKTSILFLKKKNGKGSVKQVYFAQVTKLGYTGNKNGTLVYKKDTSGNILRNKNGGFQIDEDISSTVSSYLEFKSGRLKSKNENHFIVKKDDLNYSRLDFEFYKPSYEEMRKNLLDKGAVELKELAKIKKVKSSKLRQKDIRVNYVELSDISAQYNEIINFSEQMVYELPSRASYELKEGEVITAVAGNSIGTNKHVSAYVTKKYDGCICTNGLRVLDVDRKAVNPFYLLHYLKSKSFLDQVLRYRTGAAIPSLLDSDLLNILILVPSMKEQNRIGEIIKDGFQMRRKYQEQVENLEIRV